MSNMPTYKEKARRAEELLNLLENSGRAKKEQLTSNLSLHEIMEQHAVFLQSLNGSNAIKGWPDFSIISREEAQGMHRDRMLEILREMLGKSQTAFLTFFQLQKDTLEDRERVRTELRENKNRLEELKQETAEKEATLDVILARLTAMQRASWVLPSSASTTSVPAAPRVSPNPESDPRFALRRETEHRPTAELPEQASSSRIRRYLKTDEREKEKKNQMINDFLNPKKN